MSGTDDVTALVQAFESMRVEAEGLRGDVRTIEERNQQDRRLLHILTTVSVVVFVTLVLVGIALFDVDRSAALIKDCTTPTGQCAKRAAESTGVAITSITYRTEAERLKTEIAVAEGQGNFQAADLRKRRLAEINELIAKTSLTKGTS